MFTLKENLNLPPIPEELCRRAVEIVHNGSPDRIQYRSGRNVFKIKACGDEIESWVRANITDTYYKVGLQYTEGDLLPHIDGPDADGNFRNYVLLYTVKTGDKDGVDPTTNFYQTPEGVEFNDRLVAKHLYYRKNPNRSNPGLDIVGSGKFGAGTWSLINTQCAHSVDGVGSLRVAVSVSFTKDIMPDFVREIVNG